MPSSPVFGQQRRRGVSQLRRGEVRGHISLAQTRREPSAGYFCVFYNHECEGRLARLALVLKLLLFSSFKLKLVVSAEGFTARGVTSPGRQ